MQPTGGLGAGQQRAAKGPWCGKSRQVAWRRRGRRGGKADGARPWRGAAAEGGRQAGNEGFMNPRLVLGLVPRSARINQAWLPVHPHPPQNRRGDPLPSAPALRITQTEAASSCEKLSSRRPAKRRSSMMFSSDKCTAKRSKSEPVIHSLPEGIMHDIVSRLTLKDAVRASLVSTNWRRLWTCHPNLCFDSPTILNREYGTISRRGRRRRRFIRRVDAVLESHSGAGLRGFDITFALDTRHAEHLDRWLKFALDSRASEIAVNLSPVFYKGSVRSYEWEDTYALPSHMFSSQGASYIETLQLAFASLKLLGDFGGPLNLRSCLD
ncbi:hypothetical protein ZWY2020_030613 [Hordeum vulgare]|nr:hypothetical protein ZWY2020_030613 [Hordeum vulgare]